VEGGGSPRLETARRPDVARSLAAHTTRLRPGPEARSRRAGRRAERGEVAPLVAGVEWEPVVRAIGRIDLHRTIAREKSVQRFVDENGIVYPRTCASRRGEQLLVDGRANPHTCHAIVVPQTWHASTSDVRTVSGCLLRL